MRIPQYQAWNTKLKKMQQALAIELNPEIGGVFVEGKEYVDSFTGEHDVDRDWWSWDDCELRKYTGIKDKAGKDIYVDDIVRGDQQDTAIVEWSDDSRTDRDTGYANGFSIDLEDTSVHVLVSGNDFQHQLLNVEVIGNIYESPDLIEEK